MLRKSLFFLLLVIVLVSLHWFRVLVAQDLGSLSEEDKAELLKRFKKRSLPPGHEYYYQSPDIFDGSEISSLPAHRETSGALMAGSEGRDSSGQRSSEGLAAFDELLPFGMELFKGGNSNDVPLDIPSAADYILGPGDNIIVYLWGRVEKEYNLTFDREGKIFVPQVGELIGWGLTLEQFRARAKQRFSQVYSEFGLTVSLGKIRSIRIYIAGEVRNPGAYTVSSLTSLFNALYLAGGPNERGSMRKIKLMRRGKAIAVVDLYSLLLEGDNSTDVRLQTGDVVFVPVAGARAAIRGEITRPAVYELKGEETTLDLLSLAGNPTPAAYLERVMLERISKNDQWEVLDLNVNTGVSDRIDDIRLTDGDRLTIYSIFEAKKNIVAIFGRVKHAGYYERNDSTRISDLIDRAQLHPYDVLYDRADLFRRYPDRRMEVIPVNLRAVLDGHAEADRLLRDRDSLHVYSIDDVRWKKHVYIEGEIRSPGEYPLYDKMTVDDLIFLAGSYTRGARRHQAEVARIDSSGDVSIIYLSLQNDAGKNTILREDDHLYIRRMPEWRTDRTVTVEGEVLFPGKYTLSGRAETLFQLLKRASGFTANAFPRGVVFERPSIYDNLERLQVDRLVKKSITVKEDSLGRQIRNDMVDFDASSMNRIIIDMDKIWASHGREGDMVLEAGDRIYIPAVPTGISVIGAVGVNGTIKHTKGRPVKHYVRRAGSFTRQADKKATRLVRATGEVESGRGILGRTVDIGDVIIVPIKIEKERNLMKTFTTALSAATGILTSVYIVSKL